MSSYEIHSADQIIDGMDAIVYSLHVAGTQVAHLDAHRNGLILNVEVCEAERGEGYARALYEHADAAQGLYHVPSWGRTPEGDAFAEAMGGDVMDDEDAITTLGFDDDQAAHIREIAGL